MASRVGHQLACRSRLVMGIGATCRHRLPTSNALHLRFNSSSGSGEGGDGSGSKPKPGEFGQTRSDISIGYRGHGRGQSIPSPEEGANKRHSLRTLGSFSMAGKVCVVTGGARGLGYVMTQAFVESGAHAAIIDLRQSDADKAANDLTEWFEQERDPNETKPVISGWECDVSNAHSVQKTMDAIVEKYGRIDTLLTAAGFTENFPAEEYPIERLQQLFRVNVEGTYLCAATVARHMIKQKQPGSMVLIGSMSGQVVNIPQPQAPYNASKAAVKQMGSSMAVEWAKYGIRVNTLAYVPADCRANGQSGLHAYKPHQENTCRKS